MNGSQDAADLFWAAAHGTTSFTMAGKKKEKEKRGEERRRKKKKNCGAAFLHPRAVELEKLRGRERERR